MCICVNVHEAVFVGKFMASITKFSNDMFYGLVFVIHCFRITDLGHHFGSYESAVSNFGIFIINLLKYILNKLL